MAQIVTTKAKATRCNLQAISSGGSKASTVLESGEVWLVDTTNASKGTAGYGKYDSYIVGDGTTVASSLTVYPIDDISGKADKVSSPTSGNFASLDSNGNLSDSGHKHSDYQAALTTQTAYTSKGSATKVPQITTNTLGQVTGITEVTITQPSAPGTLNTTATTAQSTNASEALSGSVTLHKVSKTGSYNDLLNKPTIPAAQIQSDWNQSTTSALDYIKNKPAGIAFVNEDIAKIVGVDDDYATIGYFGNDWAGALEIGGGYVSLHALNYNSNEDARIQLMSGNISINVNTPRDAHIQGYFNNSPESLAFLSDIPDTTDFVSKSNTAGLLKNDGTVDTSTYLTASSITGKEDKMDIITVSATSLAPSLNKYYRFTSDVGTLAVTLPTVTDTTKVASIVFYLTTGSSPNVTFTSSHTVVYQDGFQLDASKTYEVNALFNGSAWVLMAAEINTGS